MAEGAAPGLAVDRLGGPVVDPTANVQALSEASNRRQDDLRAAAERRQDDLRLASKELSDTRISHVLIMAALRAEHWREMTTAEKARIDAIRAVDVNAVAVASQRASDQASVLAAQVQQSAEALRALVATTANTVAQAQQQLESTLSARITTLEQFQYKGEGKAGVSDPAFALLLAEVKSLRESGSARGGSDTGQATQTANLRATIGLVVGAAGLLLAVFAYQAKNDAVAVPAERVVIEGAAQGQ